jgi:hypothetical protein
MKEGVFIAWWKFARITIPLIFLSLYIISLELHHSPGGWFNVNDEIDLTAYFIFITAFITGSLIQIYRGYRNN